MCFLVIHELCRFIHEPFRFNISSFDEMVLHDGLQYGFRYVDGYQLVVCARYREALLGGVQTADASLADDEAAPHLDEHVVVGGCGENLLEYLRQSAR